MVYLPNPSFPRKALVTTGSCYTPSAPSGRIPVLSVIAINDRPDRHTLCSLADRLSPYRRGPHGAVQLALRAGPRRQDAAPHRGHRPGAIDRTGDRGHSGWAEMA